MHQLTLQPTLPTIHGGRWLGGQAGQSLRDADPAVKGPISSRAWAIAIAILAALAVAIVAVSTVVVARSPEAVNPPLVRGGLDFVPGQLVIGFRDPTTGVRTRDAELAAVRRAIGVPVTVAGSSAPDWEVVALPPRASVLRAAARASRVAGIAYAVPNYIAHAAGVWIPNNPGRSHRPGGWQALQWNFLAAAGVDAPHAWANLIAEHHPGAKGVTVAVIDTGVAFRNWRTFKRSPGFRGTHFVNPCDLVSGKIVNGRCTDPYPLDREGHGTFVAGVIAEATNNGVGVPGLAYRASIMPIRVLNAQGLGSSSTIANGIRYAVRHGAQVINLSLEFYLGVTAREIPEIVAAIDYAHRRGVVVVSAAGNDASKEIAYPAAVPDVISVGATTRDRCLASYSNVGPQLDLVAPGGGDDASMPGDPTCQPTRNLPDVYQMTFETPGHPDVFGLPGGWFGTSMAAPEVSAAAAMVIASGLIGPHPTPDQILARLERTADPLGSVTPNPSYGYGLLNVGAATSPSIPPYSL